MMSRLPLGRPALSDQPMASTSRSPIACASVGSRPARPGSNNALALRLAPCAQKTCRAPARSRHVLLTLASSENGNGASPTPSGDDDAREQAGVARSSSRSSSSSSSRSAGGAGSAAATSGSSASGAAGSSGAASVSSSRVVVEAAKEVLETTLRVVPVHVPESERRRLWLAAIKPTMYSVAYVPIMVGSALSFYLHGALCWTCVAQLCAGSTLVIAWLNASNDAFDAFTGVDAGGAKPESLVAMTGASRWAVLAGAKALLLCGVAVLANALAPVGDVRVARLLGAAICCGYLYQGVPFRLSYAGLGEPLCFAAFGPLATTAFYLAQASPALGGPAPVGPLVRALSCVVGASTAAILFCSHFHQIAGDAAAGKMSPLVRLGAQGGVEALRVGVLALYLAVAWLAWAGVLPQPVWVLAMATIPKAVDMVYFAHTRHWEPSLVAPLKFRAIRWHVQLGAALTLGLLLAARGRLVWVGGGPIL